MFTKNKHHKVLMKGIALMLTLVFSSFATAQDAIGVEAGQNPKDSSNPSLTIFKMSLDELINVNVVSASREMETVFDSPLSTCVITQEDIKKAGSTSVPDALRLCQGLVVREKSNGSYEVSIRGGGDGLAPYRVTNTVTTVLVMINSRPVFNTYSGGVYWQNLPIVLTDVERIEVVEGPSAPLYGPNAVNGVINIITKNNLETLAKYDVTIQVSANVKTDISSHITDISAAHRFTNKLSLGVSFNNTYRKRFKKEFYDNAGNKFYDNLTQSKNFNSDSITYIYVPYADLGTKSTSINTYLTFAPSEKTFIELNAATNNSVSLNQLAIGKLTSYDYMNNSYNIGIRGTIKNLSAQASYLYGTQSLLGFDRAGKYDYSIIDFYTDYKINISRKFSFRPAISYQLYSVNDLNYTQDFIDSGKSGGVFRGKAAMANYSGSLKAEYKTEKIRLIGALRIDKFSAPNELYPSYQAIVNYKPAKNHIIRFVAGRSYQGSFLSATYLNAYTSAFTYLPGYTGEFLLKGSKDRDLMHNDSYEIGYRTKFKSIKFDIDLFSQNYSGWISTNFRQPLMVDTLSKTATINQVAKDIDLVSRQLGVSIYLTANFFKNALTIRPSITFQQTKLDNYSPYFRLSSGVADSVNIQSNQNSNVTWKGTPSYFGNLYIGYAINNKVNIAVTSYYYAPYRLTLVNGVNPNGSITDRENVYRIRGKYIYNLTISYRVTKDISLYANGRNILNNLNREDVATDQIGRMILFGVTVQ